ncbi:hypothetical protein ACSLBF_19355 (plasmid) [Pseudoalteromonas sp. T1lg65]|uniref:hypothetical protein n=1 Tax=Pseudoalteromonas sp. T1lg65 TaxID=2077101 RepID=UPI003F7A3911
MKNKLIAAAMITLGAFSFSSEAAQMKCDVWTKNGNTWGTTNCFGMDFSFGRSTTAKFYITGVTKPVDSIVWTTNSSCSSGTSCTFTASAYRTYYAEAKILYSDGTWEKTNRSTLSYETGH